MIQKFHTFAVDITSETDNQRYQGNFTVKRLSISDRSAVNLKKTQLCGGFYTVRDENGDPTGKGIDSDAEFFNYALAYLEVALVKGAFPSWFNPDEITDETVVLKIFTEAFDWENSFRRRPDPQKDGHAKSGEGNSQEKHEASNLGSGAAKVVDPKVQAALEP